MRGAAELTGVDLPGWRLWVALGLAAWALASLPVAFLLARLLARKLRPGRWHADDVPAARTERSPAGVADARASDLLHRRRVLVVDDDPGLRLLLRTTFSADEFEVEEADSAEQASTLVRLWAPAFVILDIGLPGTDGLAFCAQLARERAGHTPRVILLTGADTSVDDARQAGADALLRKPFSPLELAGLLDEFTFAEGQMAAAGEPGGEQLLLYARDLSRLLEIERAQRRLLQQAYRQTTSVLADALEAKDRRTSLHALRVQRYALELTSVVQPGLLDDASLEHGFLLHDIGKIAIPEPILNKPGALSHDELKLVQQHPLIGVEILGEVALLQGEGLRVVRSHHERWDGFGYPDGLAEEQIPLGARIFAVADTLDAITTDRPYRQGRSWGEAVDEILSQDGRQFDPRVVSGFAACEPRLRRLQAELVRVAA